MIGGSTLVLGLSTSGPQVVPRSFNFSHSCMLSTQQLVTQDVGQAILLPAGWFRFV